jgi:hypothetical protein
MRRKPTECVEICVSGDVETFTKCGFNTNIPFQVSTQPPTKPLSLSSPPTVSSIYPTIYPTTYPTIYPVPLIPAVRFSPRR